MIAINPFPSTLSLPSDVTSEENNYLYGELAVSQSSLTEEEIEADLLENKSHEEEGTSNWSNYFEIARKWSTAQIRGNTELYPLFAKTSKAAEIKQLHIIEQMKIIDFFVRKCIY